MFNLYYQRVISSPTITNWTNLGLNNLRFILLIPFIMGGFQANLISLWLFLGIFTTFILLFSKGLVSVFIRILSYILAGSKDLNPVSKVQRGNFSEVDKNLFNKTIYHITFLFKLISILILIVSYVGLILTVKNLNIEYEYLDSLILFISFSIMIGFYNQIYYAILFAGGEIARFNIWNSVFAFFNLIGSLGIFYFYNDFFYFIIFTQSFNFFLFIRNYLMTKNYLKKYRVNGLENSFNLMFLKPIFESTWKGSIANFSYQGTFQVIGIIFSQIGEAEEIAPFLFALRVITILMQIANTPYSMEIPNIARSIKQGNIKTIQEVLYSKSKIVFLLFAFLVLIVGLLSYELLDIISSNISFVHLDLWLFMGLLYLVDRINTMLNAIQNATNNIIFHWYHFSSFVITVLVSVPLYEVASMYGLIIAQLVPRMLIFNTKLINTVAELIELDKKRYILLNIVPLIILYSILSMLLWSLNG